MGSRVRKAWILGLVLTCASVQVTSAATIKDLYDKYEIDCDVECPPSAIKTIAQYQRAEKYNTMYQYVMESSFDPSILTTRINNLEERLENIESQLLNGCDLDQNAIYALEAEYTKCMKQLQDAQSSMEVCDVSYEIPDIGSIPSYEEYIEAIKIKDMSSPFVEIGDITDCDFPVEGSTIFTELTPTKLSMACVAGSTMYAPLSGRIVDVSDGNVTIYCGGEVYMLVDGLKRTAVRVGDTVVQGEVIGKAEHDYTLKLKIAGKLQDVSRLFDRE